MNKKPIKLINLAALSKSRLNLDIKNPKRDFATKLSSLTLLKIAPIFHICRPLCVKNFTKRLFHQKTCLKKRAKKYPDAWTSGQEEKVIAVILLHQAFCFLLLNLFLKRLDDVLKRLKNEKEINIKLKEYRKSNCRDLFKQDAFDVYIDHLSEVTQSIEKTIQNLKLHIKPNEE